MTYGKPILLLDCYVDPEGGAGNYTRWMEDRSVEVVRPTRARPPVDPTAYSGVVVSGSAACLPDGVPWAAPVIELVRRTVVAGVPYLGVCFGHQLLGEALGGDGNVRKMGRPEVGWKDVDVDDPADPLLGDLAPRFRIFISHEDEVGVAPDGVTVIARSADCAVQAMRVEGRRAWGVQFHAEMGLDEARALLHRRATKHPELGLDPAAELGLAETADDVAPELFARWLATL